MVAGAAALVLEKHPRYTPAEVKQYLIDMATDGAIESIPGNQGTNKLLFVGNGKGHNNCSYIRIYISIQKRLINCLYLSNIIINLVCTYVAMYIIFILYIATSSH